MVTKEAIKKAMALDPGAAARKASEEVDRELGELDADIARAATSWSSTFPGRKEVPRWVALRARNIMAHARLRGIRPSAVRGLADERFFVEVNGLNKRLEGN